MHTLSLPRTSILTKLTLQQRVEAMNGYTYEMIRPTLYTVTNPDKPRNPYAVELTPRGDHCSCPWHGSRWNRTGHCKHAAWLRQQLASEMDWDGEAGWQADEAEAAWSRMEPLTPTMPPRRFAAPSIARYGLLIGVGA